MVMKQVVILLGAGSIGQAIARRVSAGKHLVLADYKLENAQIAAKILENAGFECSTVQTDLSSRASIKNMIAYAQQFGEIFNLINAAGVSPSQAPVNIILQTDLYGTAVLMEEVGKVIAEGGSGIIITPLANDELHGPRKDGYLKMIQASPAGRAGTPDEVGDLAEFLMSSRGRFISGADFLIDGGTTASYWYGDLQYLKATH